MAKIIKENGSIVACISGYHNYVKALKKSEELAVEHGLKVADMPSLIKAAATSEKLRKVISKNSIDTLTTELRGQRCGERIYEVWHGFGPFVDSDSLAESYEQKRRHGMMPIREMDWSSVGLRCYKGDFMPRVHLEDIKKGDIPIGPYSVFVRLYVDKPKINDFKLDYDEFMTDDRVLMLSGSEENRETLAKMLFDHKKNSRKGRKWKNLGGLIVNDPVYYYKPKGHLVFLSVKYEGLAGKDNWSGEDGNFIALKEESKRFKVTSKGTVHMSAEEEKAIFDQYR